MSPGYFEPEGKPVRADALRLPRAIDFAEYVTIEGRFTSLVACYDCGQGREAIAVDLDCEVPQRPAVAVQRLERVLVTFFPKDKRLPDIRALRRDFPRECVMHLNLDSKDKPASLCVFAEPWDEVRLRLTAMALAERIRMWVADTAAGDLHRPDQALEPFTLGPSSPLILSNELLSALVKGHVSSDRLGIVENAPGRFSAVEVREGRLIDGVLRPCLVVSAISKPHRHSTINSNPATMAELATMLADPSVGIDLVSAVATETMKAASNGSLAKMGFVTFLAMLLRLRDDASEPEPELVAFFGLPRDSNQQGLVPLARALGLLESGHTKAINGRALEEMTTIKLSVQRELEPETASAFSGLPVESKRIFAIGAGALGSQVLLNSVRGGIAHWTVIDDDHLLPHNLVRHALGGSHLGHSKAHAVASVANSIYGTPKVKGILANVLRPGEQGETVAGVLREADAIVDMSASVAVARFLGAKEGVGAKRCSIFLNPTGTDLVLLGEGASREISLASLEMQYYRAVVTDSALAAHLRTAETASYAASCRDVTSRVPQELMGQHAGQATRLLRTWLEGDHPQCVVHRTDMVTGAITPVRIVLHPSVDVGCLGGWKVRTDAGLLAELRSQRAANLPNETGGILVGVLDFQHRTIDVVHQIPAPPDSEKQPTVYIRGSEGLLQAYEAVQSSSLNSLSYVGEWHSHPAGSACRPSDTDLTAAVWLADKMRTDGAPGLMLIVGDDDELCWMFCGQLREGQVPDSIKPKGRARR